MTKTEQLKTFWIVKVRRTPFDFFFLLMFLSVSRLSLHLSILYVWGEGECVSVWTVFLYPPTCFASWMLSLCLVKIRCCVLSLTKKRWYTIYVLCQGPENNLTPLMCHLFMLFHNLICSAGIWQPCVWCSLCVWTLWSYKNICRLEHSYSSF